MDKNTVVIWKMREDIVYKIDTQQKELRTKIGETNEMISKHMGDKTGNFQRIYKDVSTIWRGRWTKNDQQ